MTTLADEIERLAKKSTIGPFEAVQPCNTWFVVGKDRYKLAHCYSENDARLIMALANNIPAILTALRGAEQVREKAAQVAEEYCPNAIDGIRQGIAQAIREDRT